MIGPECVDSLNLLPANELVLLLAVLQSLLLLHKYENIWMCDTMWQQEAPIMTRISTVALCTMGMTMMQAVSWCQCNVNNSVKSKYLVICLPQPILQSPDERILFDSMNKLIFINYMLNYGWCITYEHLGKITNKTKMQTKQHHRNEKKIEEGTFSFNIEISLWLLSSSNVIWKTFKSLTSSCGCGTGCGGSGSRSPHRNGILSSFTWILYAHSWCSFHCYTVILQCYYCIFNSFSYIHNVKPARFVICTHRNHTVEISHTPIQFLFVYVLCAVAVVDKWIWCAKIHV